MIKSRGATARTARFVSMIAAGVWLAGGCATSTSNEPTDVGVAGSGGSAGDSTAGGGSGGGAGKGGSSTMAGSGGSLGKAGSGGTAGAGGQGGVSGMGGGGASGSAGKGGTGGMPAADEFRYARLRALSNLTGNAAWASVAEIQLLTTNETPIARTNWTITADSEETADENAPATAAIDGSSTTFWHSAWVMGGVGDAPLPHHITIDMKAPQKVIGFTYLPRQDATENGQIAMYEFYLSNDAQNFGQPVESGSFPAGKTMIKVVF